MKDFFKREWLYLLMIVGLVVLTIIQVSSFRFGFFTAYDEGYFLLKLQEAYDMSCITGKSQWNLLAVHWFPYLDLTSKVNSYLASSILIWISVLMVTGVSCILYDKRRFIKYLALTWLFLFGCGGALSYAPMQTAVLTWALCAFMLFHHAKSIHVKATFASLCGLLLGLSAFIIIPAALVLSVLIALVIIVVYNQNWKQVLLYLSSVVVGMLVAILYIHLCICDLGQIVDAMLFAASYIGKSGYGYDGMSFVVQYVLFFRDCLLVVLAFVGAYWISMMFKNKYLGTILYVVLILVYYHYQKKPFATSSMIMLSVPLLPLLFSQDNLFSKQTLKQSETWMFLFLLLFPLIASFGTNTYIGNRMHGFVAAWLFIWFEREYKYPCDDFKRVGLAVALLFALPLSDVCKSYLQRDDSFHFTRGNRYFAELALTESQKDYFDRVYDIMEEYHYQPKQSVVFSAIGDYCSLYAFDAVNSSNFHQIQNFHYFDKSKMLEPDFLFLTGWDSIVIAKELHEMPWGWPEEFDAYYVGTPETIYDPELDLKTLYCRKSLKQ